VLEGILSKQDRAQFNVAQSLRTILLDQVFSSTVAEVAPKQPTTGPESFMPGGDFDLPLCEMINRHSKG
jgi:hypothetical protein